MILSTRFEVGWHFSLLRTSATGRGRGPAERLDFSCSGCQVPKHKIPSNRSPIELLTSSWEQYGNHVLDLLET